MKRKTQSYCARRRSGFTLIEIMIVVSIIGLLAVLAVPALQNTRRRAQDAAFLNDVRIVEQALEQHALEKGDYPVDALVATEPDGLGGYIKKSFSWSAKTHIGGAWDWDRGEHRGDKMHEIAYAGLSIIQPGRTTKQMEEIDARIDDGDLETGRFRAHDTGYIYVHQF